LRWIKTKELPDLSKRQLFQQKEKDNLIKSKDKMIIKRDNNTLPPHSSYPYAAIAPGCCQKVLAPVLIGTD
jgi:hypothetical protein